MLLILLSIIQTIGLYQIEIGVHQIPYRTKIRRTKLSKFWLGVENFVRRKILFVENFVRRNILFVENFVRRNFVR